MMAEDTVAKVPYTPSETKRFDVSKDPFSRERIAAVHAAYKTLKEEVPFFAGITVWGSLSKGKALDEKTADATDIDFVIFIDRDDYRRTIEDFAKREDFKPRKKLSGIDQDPDFLERVRQGALEGGAEDYLLRRTVELINANVNKPVKLSTKVHAGEMEFISVDSEKYDSLFSQVSGHDEAKEITKGLGPEDELWLAYASPFFLDVGGGLKKYRRAFIEQLMNEPPERAEYLWGIVVNAMRHWERKDVIPDRIKRSFPATFEEAKRYYLGKTTTFPSIVKEYTVLDPGWDESEAPLPVVRYVSRLPGTDTLHRLIRFGQPDVITPYYISAVLIDYEGMIGVAFGDARIHFDLEKAIEHEKGKKINGSNRIQINFEKGSTKFSGITSKGDLSEGDVMFLLERINPKLFVSRKISIIIGGAGFSYTYDPVKKELQKIDYGAGGKVIYGRLKKVPSLY